MKRSFLAFLLTLLCVGLVGCEGDEPLEGGAGTDGAAAPIGVSIPTATHGWPAGVGYWAQRTIDEHPDLSWTYEKAATAQDQANQIDAMVERGIGTLVVLPMDSDTVLPALKRAKERGVYIVSVDRGLREPIDDVYLAGDNAKFGRVSAEYMAEKLNGQGKIAVLRGMTVAIDAERYNAFKEVMDQHEGIEIVDVQHGDWSREKAYEVFRGILERNPKLDAVWASDDDMALGVEKALKELGRENEMWVLGGAGMKDVVKRVMDGDKLFPADVTYPPGMIAAGIKLGVAHATGTAETELEMPEHLAIDESQLSDTPPTAGSERRTVTLGIDLITPENAEKFYFPESVY